MNYTSLVDPPVSEKYLTKYLDLVFSPSFVNSSVSVISAQGFGVLSVSRFILRTNNMFPEFPKNRVFLSFDMGLLGNEDACVRDGLTSFLAYLKVSQLLSSQETDVINELLSKPKISSVELGIVLRHITEQRGFFVTLIPENFGSLYADNRTKEISSLAGLLKINPMKTSYIFLASHEFNDVSTAQLQGFASYFTQNIVWGGEVPFDTKCAERLFENNSKWAGVPFEKDFIALASKLSEGDPTVLKHLAVTATREPSFASELAKLKTIKAQYKLIGEEFLNVRYRKLLATCLQPTQQSLLKGDFEEDSYSYKVGLIIAGKPFNPLFAEFLTKVKLSPSSQINNAGARDSLVDDLTVKELGIFELLESNVGLVVSREALAQVLWGENWHDYYSDWALNKQISNLRKKMRTCGYLKEVKVLKTEGFMLV